MTDDHLLVADAGMPYSADPDTDGIAAWLDLMEALEAICREAPQPQPRRWRDCRL